MICLGLGWAAAAWALDRHGRRPAPPDGPRDAIVVLGARLRPDGSLSGALRRRTLAAVELYRQGRAPRIIISGARIPPAPRSQAEAAAALARRLGVPPGALVLEDRATSTWENARFTAALAPGARVLLVTDACHLLRGRLVFRRHFLSVAGAGVTGPGLDRARMALREVPAIAWYALRGRFRSSKEAG